MNKNDVSTLRKGLLVLEQVTDNDGVSLNDVIKSQNLSKSTAFRMLSTLENMKYIYKIDSLYYSKQLPQSESSNEWTALKSVYHLAESLNMSIYLGKMDGTDLVMTQVLHEPYDFCVQDEIGNRVKLHLSALGKVILAHLPSDKLNSVLSKLALAPATENTFQDSQLFRYHLKAIQSDGHAFDDEERIIGIRCIAVPVFRNGQVIAALALAAPAEDISRSNLNNLAKKLHTESKNVTAELEKLTQHI